MINNTYLFMRFLVVLVLLAHPSLLFSAPHSQIKSVDLDISDPPERDQHIKAEVTAFTLPVSFPNVGGSFTAGYVFQRFGFDLRAAYFTTTYESIKIDPNHKAVTASGYNTDVGQDFFLNRGNAGGRLWYVQPGATLQYALLRSKNFIQRGRFGMGYVHYDDNFTGLAYKGYGGSVDLDFGVVLQRSRALSVVAFVGGSYNYASVKTPDFSMAIEQDFLALQWASVHFSLGCTF